MADLTIGESSSEPRKSNPMTSPDPYVLLDLEVPIAIGLEMIRKHIKLHQATPDKSSDKRSCQLPDGATANKNEESDGTASQARRVFTTSNY